MTTHQDIIASALEFGAKQTPDPNYFLMHLDVLIQFANAQRKAERERIINEIMAGKENPLMKEIEKRLKQEGDTQP